VAWGINIWSDREKEREREREREREGQISFPQVIMDETDSLRE
jgi:hypothetical protein